MRLPSGDIGVSESLKQQIDRLEEIYKSELDPRGRAFVPLADAHRQLGDLDKALAVIQEGLVEHPDFASAHVVLGWVYRSREELDDSMRSFERVLVLDAGNTVARAAIAELIEDQKIRATADGRLAVPIASLAPGVDRPVVPIASLAPGIDRPVVPIASLAPAAPGVDRPVVPIASLAPGVPAAPVGSTVTPPDAAPEVSDDDRRVVPIASLAPQSVPGDDDRLVVPITSLAPGVQDTIPTSTLAPEAGEDAPEDDGSGGGEIYTQTLAELYAAQGATDRAIEVYIKLIADDPDNGALQKRLDALEALDPGSEVAPAELNVRTGLGALMAKDERQPVPIESLAPDGNAG